MKKVVVIIWAFTCSHVFSQTINQNGAENSTLDSIAQLSNKIDSCAIDSLQKIDTFTKSDLSDSIMGIILLLLLILCIIGIRIIVTRKKKKELEEIDAHLTNAESAIVSRNASKARDELTVVAIRIKELDVERRNKYKELYSRLEIIEANIELDKCIMDIESSIASGDFKNARRVLNKAKAINANDIFRKKIIDELTTKVETLELNAKIDSYLNLANSAVSSRKVITARKNLEKAKALIEESSSFYIQKLKKLSSRIETIEKEIQQESNQKIEQLKNDFEKGNFADIRTIESQAKELISSESPKDIKQVVNTFVANVEEQYKNGLAQAETAIQHVVYDAIQIQAPNKEGFYCYTLFPAIDTVLYPYRRKKVERRGYSEESFQETLSASLSTFSNLQVLGDVSILPCSGMHPYEPDIAIVEKTFNKGIRIDVEIDEPYTGYDRKPIHFIGCGDGYRDQVLVNHGWIVVRFSEKQIIKESRKCIAFIKYIISTILNTGDVPFDFPTYDKRWTESEARIMSVENYRERMLHHEFGITETFSQATIDSTQTEAERKASLEVKPIVYERKTYTNLNQSTDLYPQDALISFDPAEHIYLYRGQEIASVSTLVARFFPEFNPIDHAGRVAQREGCSTIEILERWDAAGAESREVGTFMHEQIERILNSGTPQMNTPFHYDGQYIKIDKDVSIEKELQFFKSFRIDNRLQPYRTEWRIFDEQYNIAGTIDLLCKHGNTFEIYDWKRSRKAQPDELIYHYGINGLESIPDIAFYHYALQQNLYKYILETNYGIKISKMHIVILHPDYDEYLEFEIPLMDREVKIMLNRVKDISSH